MKLSFLYWHSGACSDWRQGGARITGLSDLCVGRTLPVTKLLPQCLLQVETGRYVHCLICCIITKMLAPSGDRAVHASLDYLIFVLKKLINGYGAGVDQLLVQSVDGCQETWGGCHGLVLITVYKG